MVRGCVILGLVQVLLVESFVRPSPAGNILIVVVVVFFLRLVVVVVLLLLLLKGSLASQPALLEREWHKKRFGRLPVCQGGAESVNRLTESIGGPAWNRPAYWGRDAVTWWARYCHSQGKKWFHHCRPGPRPH